MSFKALPLVVKLVIALTLAWTAVWFEYSQIEIDTGAYRRLVMGFVVERRDGIDQPISAKVPRWYTVPWPYEFAGSLRPYELIPQTYTAIRKIAEVDRDLASLLITDLADFVRHRRTDQVQPVSMEAALRIRSKMKFGEDWRTDPNVMNALEELRRKNASVRHNGK